MMKTIFTLVVWLVASCSPTHTAEPIGHATPILDVHRVRIQIPADGINGLWREPRKYVEASISNAPTGFLQVGVRLKGNSGSRQPLNRKPSLSVDVARFLPDQRILGLRRFHLNNCVQDPSSLNEILYADVFENAGVPSPKCVPARVILNDRDLGIYVLREAVDEDFLSRYFVEPQGDRFQGHYGTDLGPRLLLTHDDKQTASDLDALERVFEIRKPQERYAMLAAYIDMPAFHSFMAAEILCHHFDGYCNGLNNYRLFWPRTSRGPTHRVILIPHGTDQLGFNPHTPVIPLASARAARAVITSSSGRARYRSRMAEILTNAFNPWKLSNLVQALQRVLEAEFQSLDTNAARIQGSEAEKVIHRVFARYRHLEEYFQMKTSRMEIG